MLVYCIMNNGVPRIYKHRDASLSNEHKIGSNPAANLSLYGDKDYGNYSHNIITLQNGIQESQKRINDIRANDWLNESEKKSIMDIYLAHIVELEAQIVVEKKGDQTPVGGSRKRRSVKSRKHKKRSNKKRSHRRR